MYIYIYIREGACVKPAVSKSIKGIKGKGGGAQTTNDQTTNNNRFGSQSSRVGLMAAWCRSHQEPQTPEFCSQAGLAGIEHLSLNFHILFDRKEYTLHVEERTI